MFSCFHWKLFRFDDASVSPTSLQNALNTSAYVIFYEMLKTTRNKIVSPAAAGVEIKSKATKVMSSAELKKRSIGHQLPVNSPPPIVFPKRITKSLSVSREQVKVKKSFAEYKKSIS